MAYYGSPASKYAEMAIPIILIIVVLLVVGAKFYGVCIPGLDFICASKSYEVLILTTQTSKPSAEALKNRLGTLVGTTAVYVQPNVNDITPGVLTSQNYKLVMLYGDDLALTNKARTELANYVKNGGSLLILKGAGLRQLKSDGSLSEFVFGWGVGDMNSIIKFRPSCPITNCNSVSDVTVTRDELGSEVSFVPINFNHPIIKMLGLRAAQKFDLTQKDKFDSITLVNDEGLVAIASLDWFDAEGKPRSTPAIITYDTGSIGAGGRVTYLAFDPLQLDYESLFTNVMRYSLRTT
ncbi:MAG: hypothetical protein J7L23_00975 [Candidatus Diapherotrites archaeon]|nr:hypothetical protein [Candidatus Diapherotrites archaeon]